MATRLYLVAAGDNGELYSIHQTAANGGWSAWQPLGAPPGERFVIPTLSASLDGRLELFALSVINAGIWHRWQTAQYGGWHDWVRLPDPPGVHWHEGQLAVCPGDDGRLEMFCANGTDRGSPLNQPINDVWHRWQTAVNGGWSSWIAHGQPPDASQLGLRLAMNSSGRLDLLCALTTPGAATQEWHTWHLPQNVPNGSWSTWQQLPDLSMGTTPFLLYASARNQDGRLEVFGQDRENLVWQMFQNTPDGAWHDWVPLGKPTGWELEAHSLVAAANADGRLELFGLAKDGQDQVEIWHIWQTAPNNGWASWHSMGGPGSGVWSDGDSLAVGASSDGRLELFASAFDGNLWHIWQTAPSNGWSSWTNRGRPVGTTRLNYPKVYAS